MWVFFALSRYAPLSQYGGLFPVLASPEPVIKLNIDFISFFLGGSWECANALPSIYYFYKVLAVRGALARKIISSSANFCSQKEQANERVAPHRNPYFKRLWITVLSPLSLTNSSRGRKVILIFTLFSFVPSTKSLVWKKARLSLIFLLSEILLFVFLLFCLPICLSLSPFVC